MSAPGGAELEGDCVSDAARIAGGKMQNATRIAAKTVITLMLDAVPLASRRPIVPQFTCSFHLKSVLTIKSEIMGGALCSRQTAAPYDEALSISFLGAVIQPSRCEK